MPILEDKDGKPIGFICGRNAQRTKLCTYCRRPGDRLCDATLTTGPRAGKTCDVAMCASCTFRPAGSEADYCRDHRVGLEARP